MKKDTILFILFLFIISSCDKLPTELKNKLPNDVKKSLEDAGKNRTELETVLIHYCKTPQDSLKFKAACFLIKNMNGHYSLVGKNVNKFEALYTTLSHVSIAERKKVYQRGIDSLKIEFKFNSEYDLQHIRAKFLIQHIDQAFKTWEATPWHSKYSFDAFCEYVLPYRIDEEKLSLWRPVIEKKYKQLFDKIYFEVGILYEAEKAIHINANEEDEYSASNLKTVCISPNQKIVFKDVHSQAGEKVLLIRHFNGGKDSKINVIINQKDTISVTLKYTGGLSKPTFSLTKVPIHVENTNTISLECKTEKVSIDYIELVPILDYQGLKHSRIVSGATYQISNKLNSASLTIDNDSTKLLSKFTVSKFQNFDSQKFILSYADYGFYKIRTYAKHSVVLDVLNFSKDNGGELIIFSDLNGFNQLWTLVPANEKGYFSIVNRNSGKCLEINSKYSKIKNQVTQSEFSGSAGQLWKFELLKKPPLKDSLTEVKMGTAIEASFRTFQETLDFEWYLLNGNMPSVDAIHLINTKIGNCREEVQYLTYLSRGLGIPITYDFVPQWPNRSMGHSWNVLIDEKGKVIRFHFRNKPGGHVFFWDIAKAKVFRNTFSINSHSLSVLNNYKQHIPVLFENLHFVDVTEEYTKTSDIKVTLNQNIAEGKRFAYLSIFNNKDWTPIYWGEIKRNIVVFNKMGRNVVYLPIYYDETGNTPAGNAFLLTTSGKIKLLKPNTKKLQRMVLHRKYPYLLSLTTDAWINDRMVGGKFQGANNSSFTNPVDLYTFNSITDGRFYNIEITNNRAFKYLRYIGADGKHCNINELMFYNDNETEIKGKIIGTSGSFEDDGLTKEKAFDKDILTVFDAPQPNGAWVGLKLKKPSTVSKIRFIPRTDGNIIEPGDKYELVYWNNGWKSVGKPKAISDSLVFDNVPSGAIYLLHDLTKGSEERIFTYEKGKQVWW